MDKVITVCYKQRQEWSSRAEAEEYFLEGMMCSEGAEQSRYANIYCKLKSGMTFCTDDD